RTGSHAWRSLLVAQDWDRVMLGWLCLLFGWDTYLGSLLGYPNCCIEAFALAWPRARATARGDVGWLLIADAASPFVGRFNWSSNVFARYFGYHVTQHFPCRLGCPETLALAQRNLEALLAFEPNAARLLREMLGAAVLVGANGNVALLPGAELYES